MISREEFASTGLVACARFPLCSLSAAGSSDVMLPIQIMMMMLTSTSRAPVRQGHLFAACACLACLGSYYGSCSSSKSSSLATAL